MMVALSKQSEMLLENSHVYRVFVLNKVGNKCLYSCWNLYYSCKNVVL